MQGNLTQAQQEFQELFEDSEDNVLPPENIVVLNEVRSATDLKRMMADDDSIEIGPDFQREEVWGEPARARFIDSLSKEFPIPSMCFALDPKTQKYIVIDGRQRMSTIMKFLGGDDWVIPKLNDIDSRLAGKSVAEIKVAQPAVIRKIENVSLPVTILRYDPLKPDNMEYIYTIFQRLNSLGERLNNQEIRNAVYQGSFNTFLRNNARRKEWEEFNFPNGKTVSPRMVNEEVLLRFFAFYDNLEKYAKSLNSFLNAYMLEKRFIKDNNEKQAMFDRVLQILKKVDSTKVNKSNALRDAFLYGVAQNLDTIEDLEKGKLEELLADLEKKPEFSVKELSGATMAKQKVLDRLHIAKNVFSPRD